MHHILVAGGDKRNVFLAEILKNDGHKVSVCGFNEETLFPEGIERISDIKNAMSLFDIIVLPLPLSFDGITLNTPYGNDCIYIDDILRYAKKECVVVGGRVGNEILAKYPFVTDYSKREDFAFLNAVPTAEGAIEAAMKETNKTLWGAKCMVTGFGKCARVLAMKLKSLMCEVHIFARSARDLAHAQCLGFKTFHLNSLKCEACNYDMIFNTVPFGIFGEAEVENMQNSTLFIDIASAPGGIAEDADKSKLSYRFLPGLPGKYSPYTAAEIIKKVISAILLEKGKGA